MYKSLNKTLPVIQTKFCKLAFLATIFIFFSFTLYAGDPGRIEGLVSDAENHEVVPNAVIELLRSSDSTVVTITQTNVDGKYVFDNVNYGKYFIRISILTYRTQVSSAFEITPQKPSIILETINLIIDSKAIGEVNVVGRKLTGVIKGNKTIYQIKSESAEMDASALELLRQVPDVTVNYLSNELKLAGSNNVICLVNGKKVDNNYLLQLNPELIDKIEVSTNPGVKYDSNIDAVINLILKKNIQLGLNGRLRTDIPLGKTQVSNNNLSFDFFKKNIRFYISGRVRLEHYYYYDQIKRINLLESGDTDSLIRNGNGTQFNTTGNFSYGFDWFINEHNTFNFYSSVQPHIPNNNDYSADILNHTNQSDIHRKNFSNYVDNNYFYDYSLFYKHQFAKEGHELSLESYISNRNTKYNNYSYENNYDIDGSLSDQILNAISNDEETNNKQFILKADYTYPITEEFTISAGYNGNYSHSYDLIDQTVSEVNSSDKIDYNENRQSGYLNLSISTEKLNFESGVRLEYSNINILHGYDTTNTYSFLLPFISMQYKLGKKNVLRLNYRRSIQRPQVKQLSPMSFIDDPYSSSTGNPTLNPSYTDRMEFSHRIQIVKPMFLTYCPYISFTSNAIRLINLDSADNILRSKYKNVGNEFEYGITLSGTMEFVKWWSLNPTFTYYNRILDAMPEYNINKRNRTSWRLGVSSNFNLSKEWIIFFDYNYAAPIVELQGSSQENYTFVAGVRKKINKSFNVMAFTMNPWQKRYKNTTETSVGNLMQYSEEGINNFSWFVIRLGFKFNYGKEVKKLDRPTEDVEDFENKKKVF